MSTPRNRKSRHPAACVLLTALLAGCENGTGAFPTCAPTFSFVAEVPASRPVTITGTWAFAEEVDGRDQLFLSAFDGSDRRRVVIGSIAVPEAYGNGFQHEDEFTDIFSVNLSPDGQRIALAVRSAPGARVAELVVLNRDGSNARAASPVGPFGGGQWSPDQSKLAYTAFPDVGTPSLWVTDLLTDELRHFELGNVSGHAWADDSAAIYFWLDRNTAYQSSVFKLDIASGQVATVYEDVPGWVYGLQDGVVLAECLDAEYRGTLFDFDLSNRRARIIRTAPTAPGRVNGFYFDADGYAQIGIADTFGVWTSYLMTDRDYGFTQIEPVDIKGDFHPE